MTQPPDETIRPPERTTSPRGSWASRFFGVITRPASWRHLLYLALTFPLGLFYFVFLVTMLSVGIGLVIIWVGIFILALTAACWWAFAAFERQMADSLLGTRLTPAPRPWEGAEGTWPRIKAHFGASATWKDLAYLFVKFPLGVMTFTIIVTLGSVSVALLGAPFYYRFAQTETGRTVHHGIFLGIWNVDRLWEALLLVPIGLLLLIVSFHAFNGLAAMWRGVSRGLLPPATRRTTGEATASAPPGQPIAEPVTQSALGAAAQPGVAATQPAAPGSQEPWPPSPTPSPSPTPRPTTRPPSRYDWPPPLQRDARTAPAQPTQPTVAQPPQPTPPESQPIQSAPTGPQSGPALTPQQAPGGQAPGGGPWPSPYAWPPYPPYPTPPGGEPAPSQGEAAGGAGAPGAQPPQTGQQGRPGQPGPQWPYPWQPGQPQAWPPPWQAWPQFFAPPQAPSAAPPAESPATPSEQPGAQPAPTEQQAAPPDQTDETAGRGPAAAPEEDQS